jgi:hypothetical protein
MSDTASNSGAGNGAATTAAFTQREMELLSFAMQSLKSGPPEVSTIVCYNHVTSLTTI